jgi:hypothetical protein
MNEYSNGVTLYRLKPEEIENFLTAKYGKKMAAVDQVKMAKRKQKIAVFNARYKQAGV